MNMMTATTIKASICFLLVTAIPGAVANEQEGVQQEKPYVSVNVGVEINGLEQATQQAAQGLVLIGESLDKIASGQELTPEQSARVQQALTRVDELGESLNLTVGQLPGTVEKSIAPIVEAGNELSSQIKLIVILTSVGLVIIILAALVAIYYFALMPTIRAITETVSLLKELASTLKTTAEIVEQSSEQNQQILGEMLKLQGGNN